MRSFIRGETAVELSTLGRDAWSKETNSAWVIDKRRALAAAASAAILIIALGFFVLQSCISEEGHDQSPETVVETISHHDEIESLSETKFKELMLNVDGNLHRDKLEAAFIRAAKQRVKDAIPRALRYSIYPRVDEFGEINKAKEACDRFLKQYNQEEIEAVIEQSEFTAEVKKSLFILQALRETQ